MKNESGVPDRRVAALAVGLYAAHGSYHVLTGHPEDLLWACHLATILVALGWWTASPIANGIGLLWLAMGDAMWVLNLVGGGELIPTSLFTHVGGLVLSIVGVRRFGWPGGLWWRAILAFAVLQQACRWLTPPVANVNVAFSVWPGWEDVPNFASYRIFLLVVGAGVFALIDWGLTKRGQSP